MVRVCRVVRGLESVGTGVEMRWVVVRSKGWGSSSGMKLTKEVQESRRRALEAAYREEMEAGQNRIHTGRLYVEPEFDYVAVHHRL